MATEDLCNMMLKFLTVRRIYRTICGCAGLIFAWILWQWTTDRNQPYSAVWCKTKLPEILWPLKVERDKALLSYGKDSFALEEDYFQFVTNHDRMCYDQPHLGPSEDGGWEVCLDSQYSFKKPCLVYSFGIDHDFRFEKGIEDLLGCEVHAFDPSMGESSHQYSKNGYFHNMGIDNIDGTGAGGRWRLRKLSTIMKELNHTNRDIDYLKLDVEFSEWPALHEMLHSGSIQWVRQLVMETHTPEVDIHQHPNNKCTWSRRDTLAAMLKILIDLRNAGFSTYYTRTNYRTEFRSGLTQKMRHCCHNLHMVNTKHTKNKWIPPPQRAGQPAPRPTPKPAKA